MNRDLSREELFLLIWERPTKKIATELGVSGTELSKLCRQIKAPKPPPGYWAQIKLRERQKKPLPKQFGHQIANLHDKQMLNGKLAVFRLIIRPGRQSR